MIPKTIHYCWFSNEKKPKSIQKCIDSWKRVMPDYEIKCWDGNSFDFDSLDFTREAIQVKQYPAAADYIRLYALFSEGGIYLDSDVLVLRPFDSFLDHHFFCGTEAFKADGTKKYRMEAAVMGAEPNNTFVKQCMEYYETRHFIQSDGSYDNHHIVMPEVISQYAEALGYQRVNSLQSINDITIYPTTVFTNTLCYDASQEENLYAVHQNAGSWIDYSDRGWLFNFCRKHDLMDSYHKLESITRHKK